jgi:hypothetical protein
MLRSFSRWGMNEQIFVPVTFRLIHKEDEKEGGNDCMRFAKQAFYCRTDSINLVTSCSGIVRALHSAF